MMTTPQYRARRRAVVLLASTALAVLPAGTWAQTPPPPPVLAPQAAQLKAVVVTARHRKENLQKIPVSASAIGAAELRATRTYTIDQLQHETPSVVLYNANPRNSSIAIRGVGITSASDGLDTAVGVYINGVYLGRPGMALQDLIDIDQIEILRGPQGTLWGRNTALGAINITTEDPSFKPGAVAEVSAGSLGYSQLRATVTSPVNDKVAVRLTGYNTYRNGNVTNIYNGKEYNGIERAGGALAILINPSANVTIHVNADFSEENDSQGATVTVGLLNTTSGLKAQATYNKYAAEAVKYTGAQPWTDGAGIGGTDFNSPLFEHTHNAGASTQVDWLHDGYTFTSITAYRLWDFDPAQDSDGTPLDIYQVNVSDTHDTQETQEFRVTSPTGGKFDWQSGIFLLNQSLKDHYIGHQYGAAYDLTILPAADTIASGLIPAAINPANAKDYYVAPGSQYNYKVSATSLSGAIYGQGTYHITDNLDFTGGLRGTHDVKYGYARYYLQGDFNAAAVAKQQLATVNGTDEIRTDYQDNNLTGSAALTLKISPAELAYASFASGYEAGGSNLNSNSLPNAAALYVKPVTVYDYQLGLKQNLFNDTLILDTDLFLDDVYNYQYNVTNTFNAQAKSYLSNIKGIQTRGVEVDALWQPIDNLLIHASGDYDNAFYQSYHDGTLPPEYSGTALSQNETGRAVFLAPVWTGNATAQYSQPVNDRDSVYEVAEYYYTSGYFSTADDSAYSWVKAHGVANLRFGIKLDNDKYDLSVWGNNVLNKHYFETISASGTTGLITGVQGDPIEGGVTARVNF